jgi:hypothetical protein
MIKVNQEVSINLRGILNLKELKAISIFLSPQGGEGSIGVTVNQNDLVKAYAKIKAHIEAVKGAK